MTKRFRRVTAITSVGVVLLVGSQIAVAFHRYGTVEREFASVLPGGTRPSVVDALGMPNHSGRCGTLTNFSPAGCALEYVYSHPFAPVLPEYYVVSFSADGRVIRADRLDSP